MATETEAPIQMRMQAAVLSGSRRGEIADIVVGEPNGLFINDCENPPNFVPEKVDAVFIGFPFEGKKTTLTLAFDGSVMDATDPELTPEEREAWDELMEISKRTEATAKRIGKAARQSSEKLRRSTAELRASNNSQEES